MRARHFGILTDEALDDPRIEAAGLAIGKALSAEDLADHAVRGVVPVLALHLIKGKSRDGVLPGDGIAAVRHALGEGRGNATAWRDALLGAGLLEARDGGLYLTGWEELYGSILRRWDDDREAKKKKRDKEKKDAGNGTSGGHPQDVGGMSAENDDSSSSSSSSSRTQNTDNDNVKGDAAPAPSPSPAKSRKAKASATAPRKSQADRWIEAGVYSAAVVKAAKDADCKWILGLAWANTELTAHFDAGLDPVAYFRWAATEKNYIHGKGPDANVKRYYATRPAASASPPGKYAAIGTTVDLDPMETTR